MDKRVGWVIFTSTLLPPPFPFTPVIIERQRAASFTHKTLTGAYLPAGWSDLRSRRYWHSISEDKILRFLNSPISDYVVYALIGIALIGSILSLMKWLRSNKRKKEAGHKEEKTKEATVLKKQVCLLDQEISSMKLKLVIC